MFKNTLSALLLLALLSLSVQAQDRSKEDIEKIVREYILENPEVIIESIQLMQERERLARLAPILETYKEFLYNERESNEAGNPKGDVTIVEFFDYRCGYCKRHYSEVMRLVKEDKNIRLIFKHYPILDYNDKSGRSKSAALGAMAAGKQGKFQEFHHMMMTTDGDVTKQKIDAVAQKIGLDMAQFALDMKSSVLDKKIMNALVVGNDLDLTGTPAYIIGTNIVSGARGFEHMKKTVARARAAQSR
ncbi:DsbA family protein [Temperatibacter marinus]|uniref:DsbA family protein n=1 Tax=Temperatibacter marinus TaxID=1456591 RepID=A0AA52HA26_9PROT|nr:DsbA family protein [Temperatibacter marinus]WND02285.1 DsbA family protein [Temperatibacter marinus]